MRRTGRTTKILLSVAVVGLTAAMASMGTFATFTDSASVAHSIQSGTVDVELGATGAATNRLDVDATGIVPGDTIERSVNVINNGNQAFASISLTTTATTSSLLDTDTTDGLQMVVDKCSQAWTESGTSPVFTYTCGGTTTAVLASTPVIVTNQALSGLGLTAGSTTYLRVKLTFPSGAGNSLQGKTSVIQYTFSATQRAASAH